MSSLSSKLGLVFFGGVSCVCSTLCVWQLQRREWKIKLMAEANNKFHLSPIPFPAIASSISSSPSPSPVPPNSSPSPLHPILSPSTSSSSSLPSEFTPITFSSPPHYEYHNQVLIGPRPLPPSLSSAANSDTNNNPISEDGNTQSNNPMGKTFTYFVVTPVEVNGQRYAVSRGTIFTKSTIKNHKEWESVIPTEYKMQQMKGKGEEIMVIRKRESALKYLGNNENNKNDDGSVKEKELLSIDPKIILERNHPNDNQNNQNDIFLEILRKDAHSLPSVSPDFPTLYRRHPEDLIYFRTTPITHLAYAATWGSLAVFSIVIGRKRFLMKNGNITNQMKKQGMRVK